MAKKEYLDFSGLLNLGAGEFLKPKNELSACKNIYCEKLGPLKKVPGYDKASSSQVINAKDVNSLHYYHRPSTKIDYLIAGSDSSTAYTLKYISPNAGTPVTSWTALTGISTTYAAKAGAQPSMVNYLDKTFVVGYKSSDSSFLTNATVSGATFSAADTDLSSMPQGKFIVRYRDLLYVLHAYESATLYPSRAYFCGEPTAGAITWTVATDFIEFGYDDGDEITGAVAASDRLIVFKHFSMWKYDESTREQIADVGCDSFRSIVNIYGTIYWFNRDGIWRWTGGQPQMISNKIEPFINAITQTSLKDVVAIQHAHEYRVFIGTMTIEGITYTNAWLCFDVRREKWYVRCSYDIAKSATNFVVSGKKRAYFGDDDGYVRKFATAVDEIYDDDGEEIDSFFITNTLDDGDASTVKQNTHMTVHNRNCQGMKMAIEVDNKGVFSEDRKQIVKKNVQDFDISASGNKFRYKFYEKSDQKSWEFDGFVIETDLKEELT